MIKAGATFDTSRMTQAEARYRARIERGMLVATDKASRDALTQIRTALPGRLGRALGHFSDLKKGKVFREGNLSAASGGIYIRGNPNENHRAVGAIKSATEGAEILPRRQPWLWIATPELGIKRALRKKITPAMYNRAGFDKSIGPLVKIPGRHPGEALLIVKKVSTPAGGSYGRIRRLPKNGIPRANRVAQESIVAFVGIKRTSRTKVVDVPTVLRANAANVSRYIAEDLRKGL